MKPTQVIAGMEGAADFTAAIERLSGANVAACLQCGKCSSGCPVAARADLKPHELVRLVQLGRRDEVLTCRMIWECVSCHTCTTRCPQKVDIAAMNDALRQCSRDAELAHPDSTVPKFNDIFLRSIRKRGRVYEIGLMTAYKMRTLRLLADVAKFPMMLWKRKLALLPSKAGRRRQRKALFERVAKRRRTSK